VQNAKLHVSAIANATHSACSIGYRYTWSKNDVISSIRKHNCALGLVLRLGLW